MKMLPKISTIGYDFPMNPTPSITHKKPESTALEPVDLHALVGKLEREIVNLRRQVAWLQRQIFGQKSEKHVTEYDAVQGILGIDLNAVPGTPLSGEKTTVAAHQRRSKPAATGKNFCITKRILILWSGWLWGIINLKPFIHSLTEMAEQVT